VDDYKASAGHTPGLTDWGGYARGDGGGGVAAEIVTVPAQIQNRAKLD